MSSPVLPCAKCGHEHVYVIEPVAIPNFEYSNASEVLPVHTRDATRVGHFQARVCRACGFAEWYAKNIDALAALSKGSPATVTIVNAGPGKSGAYR